MKICSNCGATNNDNESLTCKKCGALLPVQTRRRRITLPKPEKVEEEDDIKIIGEEIISTQDDLELDISFEEDELDDLIPTESNISHPTKPSDLQEIPRDFKKPQENDLEQEVIKQDVKTEPNFSLNRKKPELKPLPRAATEVRPDSDKSQVLQEITPQPYQGSILDSKNTFEIPITKPLPTTKPLPESSSTDVESEKRKELKEDTESKEEEQKEENAKTEEQELQDSNLIEKQKLLELEEDMTKVLKFLSSKLKTNKEESTIKTEVEPIEKKIKPSNMNDILTRLVKIDNYIEAGALIKSDGTILAAAISGRFSDSLFGTIGQNLSMIGTDIIQGLSAGTLESISIRGSEGILDLAPLGEKKFPIVKDIILMVFSHPKVKRGIINMAVTSITNDIIDYLNPD